MWTVFRPFATRRSVTPSRSSNAASASMVSRWGLVLPAMSGRELVALVRAGAPAPQWW